MPNSIEKHVNEQIKHTGLKWATNATDFAFMALMNSIHLKRKLITAELGGLSIEDAERARIYLGLAKPKERFDLTDWYKNARFIYQLNSWQTAGKFKLKVTRGGDIVVKEGQEGNELEKTFNLIEKFNQEQARKYVTEEFEKDWKTEEEKWENHPRLLSLADQIIKIIENIK